METGLAPIPRQGATKVTRTPLIDIVRCARCGGGLHEEGVTLACGNCGQHYPVTDGIPQLFVPNEWGEGKLDVTDLVKEFYEETPFPNYDDLDSRESLRSKARTGVFARLLDEQIPPGRSCWRPVAAPPSSRISSAWTGAAASSAPTCA